jgi:hypothetical protein
MDAWETLVKISGMFVSLCAAMVLSGAACVASAADEAAGGANGGVSVVKGSMLVAANGARLAPVYRVGPDGAAQIIIDGKLVSVPASTLSMSSGHLTTSLTKNEVLALH